MNNCGRSIGGPLLQLMHVGRCSAGSKISGKTDKVYGVKYGIEGIKDNLIDSSMMSDYDKLDTLTYTPSSALDPAGTR